MTVLLFRFPLLLSTRHLTCIYCSILSMSFTIFSFIHTYFHLIYTIQFTSLCMYFIPTVNDQFSISVILLVNYIYRLTNRILMINICSFFTQRINLVLQSTTMYYSDSKYFLTSLPYLRLSAARSLVPTEDAQIHTQTQTIHNL